MTPTDIALRNLVANKFGIANMAIVDALIGAQPSGSTNELVQMVDMMLVGPAGNLTGTLEATAADGDCHCTTGYVAALRDICEAQVLPSALLTDEQKSGFMEGFGTLQTLAKVIADGVEATGELPPKYDDAADEQPTFDFGQIVRDALRGVATAR